MEDEINEVSYRIYGQYEDSDYAQFDSYGDAIKHLMSRIVDAGEPPAGEKFYFEQIKRRIKRYELVPTDIEPVADNVEEKVIIKRSKSVVDTQDRILTILKGGGEKGVHTSQIILELCHSDTYSVSDACVYYALSDLQKLGKVTKVKKYYRIKE